MSRHVDTGATDQTIVFWAFDSSGDAVEVTTSDAVSYRRDNNGREGTTVSLTLVARSVAGIHRDGAITYKGDGKHEIDLPDAAVGTAGEVTLEVTKSGVASVYVEKLEVSAASVDGLTTAQETTLNTIASQASQITGARINTVGPVSAAGDITLIVGKDYKVASESELIISVADTGGALHADFTSATLAESKAFGMSRDNGDADIAGTVYSVAYSSNVTTFRIEIDADQLPDTLSLTDDWTYQIERVTSSGHKVVGVQGAGAVQMRAV